MKAEIIVQKVWKSVSVWIPQEADTNMRLDVQETLRMEKMEGRKKRV